MGAPLPGDTNIPSDLELWVHASECARPFVTVADAVKLYGYMTPTTGLEGEATERLLSDPAVLREAQPSQVWSNVGEGIVGYLEWESIEEQRGEMPFVYYTAAVLVGLYLIGRTKLVEEEAAVSAMVSASWAVLNEKSLQPTIARLIAALEGWPSRGFTVQRCDSVPLLCSQLVGNPSASIVREIRGLFPIWARPMDRAEALLREIEEAAEPPNR